MTTKLYLERLISKAKKNLIRAVDRHNINAIANLNDALMYLEDAAKAVELRDRIHAAIGGEIND